MAAETETFRESERKKALEKKEKETFVQIDKLSLPREREREREREALVWGWGWDLEGEERWERKQRQWNTVSYKGWFWNKAIDMTLVKKLWDGKSLRGWAFGGLELQLGELSQYRVLIDF
jgi:hypothetical protein